MFSKLKPILLTERKPLIQKLIVEGHVTQTILFAIVLYRFFFLDDLTGFELTYLVKLPEPFSFIFTWFAALPLILYLAQSITKAIVKDFLILKGPCPNCGTENLSFFGTILSISNGGSTNTVKCSNCGIPMVYDSSTRLIILPENA